MVVFIVSSTSGVCRHPLLFAMQTYFNAHNMQTFRGSTLTRGSARRGVVDERQVHVHGGSIVRIPVLAALLGFVLACAGADPTTPAPIDGPPPSPPGPPPVVRPAPVAGSSSAGEPSDDAPDAAVASAPTPPRVRAVRVRRRDFERKLGGIQGLGDLVDLRPSMTLSGVDGLVLTSIPKGSPVADLGLRPGDTVHSINGVPLASPLDLLGLAGTVDTATRFEGEITRDGERMVLRVDLE
jgi:membrane-associated protease RseP (regulator of RpoE activity)